MQWYFHWKFKLRRHTMFNLVSLSIFVDCVVLLFVFVELEKA